MAILLSSIYRKIGLLRSYKTVSDLRQETRGRQNQLTNEQRSKFEICIIDDQSFEAGRNLRNFGYKFKEIGDVKNVDEIKGHSIVLCDLMGVGLHLDKKKQGALLIKEIRRNYPTIIVAAYSGASIISEQVIISKEYSDLFIQKDADLEEWTIALDELIKLASDKKIIWLRARKSLIDEGVDTKEIIKLEDAYVTSLISGDSRFLILKEQSDKSRLSDFAQGIISNLITGAILNAITGS